MAGAEYSASVAPRRGYFDSRNGRSRAAWSQLRNRQAAFAHKSMPSRSDIPFEALVAQERMGDPQFARLLARGIAVLRCFTHQDNSLGNADIRRRTGLPAATVFRLTYTLNLLGYLQYQAGTQRFELGSAVLSIGYPKLAHLQIRAQALPHMRKLAERYRASVNLAVADRLSMVYVESVLVDDLKRYRADIGYTQPILPTAVGRAYLAALTKREREPILNRLRLWSPAAMKKFGPSVETANASLRERGFCTSLGEADRDVLGVAVPLRREPGADVLVVNCSIVAPQQTPEFVVRSIGPALVKTVRRIEQARDASLRVGNPSKGK